MHIFFCACNFPNSPGMGNLSAALALTARGSSSICHPAWEREEGLCGTAQGGPRAKGCPFQLLSMIPAEGHPEKAGQLFAGLRKSGFLPPWLGWGTGVAGPWPRIYPERSQEGWETSDLSLIENQALGAGRNLHSHPAPFGDEKRCPVRVTQLCARASCPPRARTAGESVPSLESLFAGQRAASAAPLSHGSSGARRCSCLSFPAQQDPFPERGFLSKLLAHLCAAIRHRFLGERFQTPRGVIQDPGTVERGQPDQHSKPDSATFSHLSPLLKLLDFSEVQGPHGKMEIILCTREHQAHAASGPAHATPRHWALHVFGFLRLTRRALLSAGPCRTLLFGHLLSAFFGDPGCDLLSFQGKTVPQYFPDTYCEQARVACWGGRTH